MTKYKVIRDVEQMGITHDLSPFRKPDYRNDLLKLPRERCGEEEIVIKKL